MTKEKTKNEPKQTAPNEVDTQQLTTLLEQYLQFKRIPRFQNHQNKIIIHQENDKTSVTIQRPLEPLTKREQRILLNKTTKIEEKQDGLTYKVYTTRYTDKELETLIQNLRG